MLMTLRSESRPGIVLRGQPESCRWPRATAHSPGQLASLRAALCVWCEDSQNLKEETYLLRNLPSSVWFSRVEEF